jgi:uncharacterized protein YbaR (Trm112 family)
MISDEFIEMTRCLHTGRPLHRADKTLCERLNQAIGAGHVQNRSGETVARAIDAGLVNEDGSLLYPVYDDIPQLLSDEAIPLAQLEHQAEG